MGNGLFCAFAEGSAQSIPNAFAQGLCRTERAQKDKEHKGKEDKRLKKKIYLPCFPEFLLPLNGSKSVEGKPQDGTKCFEARAWEEEATEKNLKKTK